MGKLLTTQEASVALATPISTLRYWTQMRTGPKSIRIGGRRLYREEAIEEFIAERERAEAERASL